MIRMMSVPIYAPKGDAENTTAPGRRLISQGIGCDIIENEVRDGI